MGRVVGVEATLDELASAERVVVGVDGGRLAAEDARGVACEDAGAEALLVPSAVAALSCAAACLLCLGPVLGTAAGVGELRAAGD